MKRCRRFLKNRRGASLAEMMLAVLLLLLVTGMLTTGIVFASNSFARSLKRSESKVLYSTLENVIRNELANTQQVVLGAAEADGSRSLLRFFSSNYAIREDLSSFVVLPIGSTRGQLALGTESEYNRLLSSSAYTLSMTASVDVRYYPDPSHFRVWLKIYDASGSVLIGDAFDVLPFNDLIDSNAGS